MNIDDLYRCGLSPTRTRFLMNPLRRILFKLLKPYFTLLLGELQDGKAQAYRFGTFEARMQSIDERFGQIEFELRDHLAQLCDIRDAIHGRGFVIFNSKYGLLVLQKGDLISESIMAGEYWDSHVGIISAKVAAQRNGVAVDVGGHFGSSALAFSKYFSRVICFEPNDYNFAVLRAMTILNGLDCVEIHNCGLYSRDADLSMALDQWQEVAVPLDAAGSFDGANASNLGAYSFTEEGSGLFKHEGRTLDSYQFSDISFLKVDVQGADGEVLVGAMSTISRCLPVIVFEWESDLSSNFSVRFEEVESKLHDLGYVLKELKVHNTKQTDWVCLPPWFKN